MRNRLALLFVLLLGSLTLLAAEPPPKTVHSDAFDKLKVLVGSWQGMYEEGHHEIHHQRALQARVGQFRAGRLAE